MGKILLKASLNSMVFTRFLKARSEGDWHICVGNTSLLFASFEGYKNGTPPLW